MQKKRKKERKKKGHCNKVSGAAHTLPVLSSSLSGVLLPCFFPHCSVVPSWTFNPLFFTEQEWHHPWSSESVVCSLMSKNESLQVSCQDRTRRHCSDRTERASYCFRPASSEEIQCARHCFRPPSSKQIQCASYFFKPTSSKNIQCASYCFTE